MIFDTHAHYDDESFKDDVDAIFQDLKNHDVSLVLDPGCDFQSSLNSLKLSEKYDFVYTAVGLHPEEVGDSSLDELEQLFMLLGHQKCVAIGEIGLDYYWDKSQKDLQKMVFRMQMEWAAETEKPVIIHDREAHGDCLNMIRDYPEVTGVFHCYSGSAEMAKELLNRGWYLGFDGPITYKNNKKAISVLEICPLERILVETDSPYLSPVPMRGRRNDSRNLPYIIDKIAEVKGCSSDEIRDITTQNGIRLFNIPVSW